MLKSDAITDLFRSMSFKATPQRIAVYKYLCDNHSHPDADEIYQEVMSENPSFSKTTVYNSLKALVDNGLVNRIDIDDDRKRYDAVTAPHGHFKCTECGKIFDFNVFDIKFSGLENFGISLKNVYFSGICNRCKNKFNSN